MSIKNIKCPNCGGSIQIEDSLEKGFCMYCGGVIIVQDEIQKIKIEHTGKVEVSGKVQIDDSQKMQNFLCIAERAFEVGDFREAYTYYNKVLECDAQNTYAVLRKILSAAYISHTRIFELEQIMDTRIAAIYKSSNDKTADIYSILNDIGNFIKTTFYKKCNQDARYEFPDINQAKQTFDTIAAITKLCSKCIDAITNELMQADRNLEQEKKNYIDLGICLCKRGLSSLRYTSEYKMVQTVKGMEEQSYYSSLDAPYRDFHNGYINKFNNDYNNLPSVVNAIKNYEFEKARLQNNLAVYNQMLKEYFVSNPDKQRLHNRRAWPFVLMTIGCFLLFIISSICIEKSNIFSALLLMSLFGFLFLLVFSIVRGVQFKNGREKISAELPQELKNLRQICEENKKSLERAKTLKDNYIRKN